MPRCRVPPSTQQSRARDEPILRLPRDLDSGLAVLVALGVLDWI